MLGVGGNLGISWGWGVFGGGGLALLSVHDADHGRSAPDKEMQICRQIIGADQRRSLRVHHIWWNNETLNRKMIALGESPSEKKSALELVKVLVTTPHIWTSWPARVLFYRGPVNHPGNNITACDKPRFPEWRWRLLGWQRGEEPGEHVVMSWSCWCWLTVEGLDRIMKYSGFSNETCST